MHKKIKIILFIKILLIPSMAMSYDNDNRANQLNPNNDAYWQSRGYSERPNDWAEKIQSGNYENSLNDFNPQLKPKIYRYLAPNGQIHYFTCEENKRYLDRIQLDKQESAPNSSDFQSNLKIYKSVDSDGIVHYTDKLPSKNYR